jgi:2-haloacid dehalogenase
MIAFDRYKVLSFDCYGTLVDWETGIEDVVRPWLAADNPVPLDLVITCFALHQAKHQQTRPTLLYPEVLRRTWRDIEGTFGWDENEDHARAFAASVPAWPPFPDTIESLRYLAGFYKLAILSNVDNASIHGTIQRFGIPIDLTVTAEDVASYKPGRPHFDRAIECLAGMGIAKREILHVAQSKHHDIAPGQALNLTTVWVNRRHNRKGSGATLATNAEPDLTVNSLAELVALHKAHAHATAAG